MVVSPHFTRETINIPSAEPDVLLEVWLYLPQGHGNDPFPVIVAGHGLTVVKSAGMQAFGERWAELGWASVIMDFRGFGGSGGRRNFVCIARQTADYRSVIDWAKNGGRKKLFRSDRIVAFGSALSGINVAEVALMADEVGIAGAMTHCPLLDGWAVAMSGPTDLNLVMRAIYDWIRGKLGLSPAWIPAVANPGTTAICNSPSSWSGFMSMYEQSDKPFTDMPNIMPGRFLLEAMARRPDLSRVKCPMLVVSPDEDDLFPPHTVRNAVARSRGKVECVHILGSHFDVMKGGVGFEPNMKAQQDFLRSLL